MTLEFVLGRHCRGAAAPGGVRSGPTVGISFSPFERRSAVAPTALNCLENTLDSGESADVDSAARSQDGSRFLFQERHEVETGAASFGNDRARSRLPDLCGHVPFADDRWTSA